MTEQENTSGKTGSHALQGNIATHVHIAEAQGYQEIPFFNLRVVANTIFNTNPKD
jgi:hypothetical protein